jgi:hypothetical protein
VSHPTEPFKLMVTVFLTLTFNGLPFDRFATVRDKLVMAFSNFLIDSGVAYRQSLLPVERVQGGGAAGDGGGGSAGGGGGGGGSGGGGGGGAGESGGWEDAARAGTMPGLQQTVASPYLDLATTISSAAEGDRERAAAGSQDDSGLTKRSLSLN